MRAFALLALALLLAALSGSTRAEAPGESLAISLITVEPGEVYWERFGHNTIRVIDSTDGSDLSYNYGIFDFEQENFLLNFLRGYMTYRVAAWPTMQDLTQYVAEGREIREQRLALLPAQRAALAAFLRDNVRPEHAEYRYDYLERNCATRVRDALDDASGHAISKALAGRARGFTYRMHALRLTAPDLPLALGIHVGLGPYADRRIGFWDELFIPMELARHLREVQVPDATGALVPLVASEAVLSPARIAFPDEAPPAWRLRFLGCGLALAAMLMLLARTRARWPARAAFAVLATTIALLLGLGGLLLLVLWTLTEHRSAWANENLLLFDPLWLALVPTLAASARARWAPRPWQRKFAWLLASVAALGLFLKVFPAFAQDNLDWIALWLPVALALAYELDRPARALPIGPAPVEPLRDGVGKRVVFVLVVAAHFGLLVALTTDHEGGKAPRPLGSASAGAAVPTTTLKLSDRVKSGASAAVREHRRDVAQRTARDSAPPRAVAAVPKEDREWRRHWIAQVDRYRRREYGDDIAALMRLPPDRAWDALEQLTLEGDAVAAQALEELAIACTSAAQTGDPERFGAAVARGLGAEAILFITEAIRAEHEEQAKFSADCTRRGVGLPRLAALLRSRGIEVAYDGSVPDPLLERYRAVFSPAPALGGEDALIDAFARLGFDPERMPIDALPALLAAIRDEPDALGLVMSCMYPGAECEGFPQLTPEQRAPWIERSAELGDELSMALLIQQRREAGDLVSAYAWASFGAWLARPGCTRVPGALTYVDRVRDQQAALASMPAGQAALARQRAEALIVQLGPGARAAIGCG